MLAIAWLVPMALGCQGVFKRVYTICTQFKHLKEWFYLCMGALYYKITVNCQYNSPSRNFQQANATLVLIPISAGLFADLAIRCKVVNGGLLVPIPPRPVFRQLAM